MTQPLLEIRDLSVRFGGAAVVERANLSVSSGEILALVGESGSGKSQTLLAATGLAPAQARISGEALFEGRDLLALSARGMRALRGRRIGYVFQDPQSNLHPYKTIHAQIAEALTAHEPKPRPSRRELRDRVIELLREVGLREAEKRLDDLPRQFSGGMRQRVMIAMALALRPGLLIADEPTTALDVTVQAQILKLLKDLQESHKLAVVFVSHDLAVVSEMADRIAVMRQGRVVEQGPAERILKAPEHPYARKLLEAARSRSLPVGPPRRSLAAAKPLLSLRGVSRRFGGAEVLKGLDLTLDEGEIYALVGESGSGKTTLGRIVSGLDRADQGEARLEGRLLTPPFPPDLRRAVQVVFQDPYASLNPHRRIGAILAEPLRRAGVADPKAEVGKLLAAVSLDPALAERLPGRLSGGQRQRVAIARALALNPRLIVADEPVSALDLTTQGEILDLFARLRAERGLSLLFITHDLGVVARLCDRVGVLRLGGIVESGPVAEIFAAPQHPYTRSLLEAIPGRGLGNPAAAPREAESERAPRAEELLHV